MPRRFLRYRAVRLVTYLASTSDVPSALRFIALGAGCGVAQFFRSSLEQFMGGFFLAGALILAFGVATYSRVVTVTGYTFLMAAFSMRALVTWSLDGTPWHSDLIIFLAWGMLAGYAGAAAGELATRGHRKR